MTKKIGLDASETTSLKFGCFNQRSNWSKQQKIIGYFNQLHFLLK